MNNGTNHNTNTAYDFALFERKDSKVLRMPERKPGAKKGLESFLRVSAMLILASVIIAAFGITLSTRAQITELETKISEAGDDLKSAQEEFKQMKIELESKTSWANVEQYAVKNLGMQKAQNYQTSYIPINDGDKIEKSRPEPADKDFFTSIIEGIGDLLS